MPRYVPFQVPVIRIGISRKMRFVLSSRQSLPSSRRKFFPLAGLPTLEPSARMIFSGEERSKASGRPRHCRAIRTRYVAYPTLPVCLLLMFSESWIEAPMIWPSSRRASQMPAVKARVSDYNTSKETM